MGTNHKDLNHLSHEQVMEFYGRYVKESATQLVKDYQLAPNLKNNLYSLFPVVTTDFPCKECGHPELDLKLPRKSNYNKGILTTEAWCEACNHRILFDIGIKDYVEDVPKCQCTACTERNIITAQNMMRSMQLAQETEYEKSNTKRQRLIKNQKVKPRFIPFSEDTEKYSLMDVLTLMTMMFSGWKEEESNDGAYEGISPLTDHEGIFPSMTMSNEHPLARVNANELVKIDFDQTPMDTIVEDEQDVDKYNYRPYQCSYLPNFKNTDGEQLDIKQTYEFLARKFADGYWYREWNEQLLNVWIRIGVAECIEYARLKADEYNFNFDSEVKISEIIRELLLEYSVSECFYFISVAYWSAASFAQSNKAKSRKHAENTVPGKILSLSKSSTPKRWDRPKELPRSTFNQMLFDVMLNSGSDAGFYQCPGRSYLNMLSTVETYWPKVDEEEFKCAPFSIVGKHGLIDFIDRLETKESIVSKDSESMQITHLSIIAEKLGLLKASVLINRILMTNEDKSYRDSLIDSLQEPD